MSTTVSLIQETTLLAGPVLRMVATWAAIFGLALFFKPLLLGIVRAAVLVVRPRLSKEQRAAQSKMRDMRMMQSMIDASSGPSHAAELRALASRG